MDRKSFLRIIPGLFAVKEIAKHLATLPAISPIGQVNINRGLLYQIREGGNIVQYNSGNLSFEMLQKVFGDLFYGENPNLLEDRKIVIQTTEYGMEEFQKALEEFQKALDPSPLNRLRIGYNRFARRLHGNI